MGDGEGSVSSTSDPLGEVSRMMRVGKTSCETPCKVQLDVSQIRSREYIWEKSVTTVYGVLFGFLLVLEIQHKYRAKTR